MRLLLDEDEERLLRLLFGQFAEDGLPVTGALLEAVLVKLGAFDGNIRFLFSTVGVRKESTLDFEDFAGLLGSCHRGRMYRKTSGPERFNCSLLLRTETHRVQQALESEALFLAIALAPRMASMTNQDVISWSLAEGLERVDSVSFFPLLRDAGRPPVTVVPVQPSSAVTLQGKGFDLIFKHRRHFLPLDQFSWAPKTHFEFIKDKLFCMAGGKLDEEGLHCFLEPMIMFEGRGLLLKYHMPQPELKEGTENPQAAHGSVWTISVVDETPPEVLKIGMRAGEVLVVPWNPFAGDVCFQESDIGFHGLQTDWVQIKDADYTSCHFACHDADA